MSSRRYCYANKFVSNFQHSYLIFPFSCPAIILHPLVTLLEKSNKMNSLDLLLLAENVSTEFILRTFHGVIGSFQTGENNELNLEDQTQETN